MFTGIIESTGKVESITVQGTGKIFWISSPIAAELKIDQSLAHNGVCLTVEQLAAGQHRVTAIEETLQKTNLHSWKTGDLVNLERCMRINDRLDGHIVQGHVDTTGKCMEISDKNGSWEYRFSFPPEFATLMIEKGSICLNGISLTAYNVEDSAFSVGIIPYTYEHTNIKYLQKGQPVNLEFDLVGKYIQRTLSLNKVV